MKLKTRTINEGPHTKLLVWSGQHKGATMASNGILVFRRDEFEAFERAARGLGLLRELVDGDLKEIFADLTEEYEQNGYCMYCGAFLEEEDCADTCVIGRLRDINREFVAVRGLLAGVEVEAIKG